MKKLCIILVLSILVAGLALSSGICFAANDVYYQASSDVKLYRDEAASGDSFYIPSTYFIAVDRDRDLTKATAAITYNGETFYIKTADIKSGVLKRYDKALTNPYYIISDLAIKSDLTSISVTYDGNIETLPTEKIQGITFFGFNTTDGVNQFYVKIKNNKYAQDVYTNISSAQTNKADLAISSVVKHPSSQVSEGGSINNPSDNSPADNNLIRNILIGVICALSIVVVLLIFNPIKKNKNKNNPHDNNNPPDNYYYH